MKRQITLFSVIYFPLTAFVGFFWVELTNIQTVLFFAFWQFIMAKIIYDVIWLLTAWLSQDQTPPKLTELLDFPPVALLYTCRDDFVEECLTRLTDQNYPNYDIFVLDDSQETRSKNQINQLVEKINRQNNKGQIKVIRRDNIEGFKAGNINNWLSHFGGSYKYFVIFDNDSLAEDDFITQLVQYAEHPQNQQTAIFQSMILPWNNDNYFVSFIGAISPLSMMLLRRNSNRTGTAISFGHNNLHRTEALQRIGGFSEKYTSEDTVATFELDTVGYKTEIVNIISYEAEPPDVLKYKRRAVRWSAQTAALFRYPWRQVSGTLKIELSRQMIYYLINILFFFWVLGSIWYVDESLSLGEIFRQIIALSSGYEKAYFVSFVVVISIFIINFLLHFALAVKNRIRILQYTGHLFMSLMVFFFTITPITISILCGLFGKRVTFNPSNAETRPVSFLRMIDGMKYIWGASFIALLGYFFNQQVPWDYLGGLWALLIFVSPVFLFYSHKHNVLGGRYASINRKQRSREKNVLI